MDGDRSQKSQDEALWKAMPVAERIACVCALRHAIANDPQPFIEAARTPYRRNDAETLAAEIIPLADACKFLERQAARILASRNLGRRARGHEVCNDIGVGTVQFPIGQFVREGFGVPVSGQRSAREISPR